MTMWLCFRDSRQITFVKINGFCPLRRTFLPYPLFLTDNIKMNNEWNTNQNRMKNTPPFYIVFQVSTPLTTPLTAKIH